MPSHTTLTIDDLDAIAHRAHDLDDPSPVAAELVAAVDQGLVEDDFAAVHALLLASEIVERSGDLTAALGLAERAAGLPAEDGFARACYAELLVKSGRAEDGLAEFAAVRPELLEDVLAPSYVGAALEACGLAAVAEEWLSDATRAVIEENDLDLRDRDELPDFDAVELLYALLTERHRVREGLELPHDELDGLFHELEAAAEGPAPQSGQAMLFWPEPEFVKLLARWPERATIYGRDWDEHRAGVEGNLAGWSASGTVHLGLIAGSLDDLIAFATAGGVDPAVPETHADYADELSGITEWPPQRNAPCWCGSGAKYKKCCLPRSRD
ncbi:SEC-C metal-binding domain-containing protein [Actinoplanes regularis]|uniref:SEC-C motif-containing protein n=1 Tax=Actinoplanes regularis TaxID=52697 RepID=A0A239BIM1_9ACTN|nr:SEC-C metal-binding domain-containing protein [Actinoplanes regularis]GIE88011.1 preprotein translocase SecA [Actinoplanes regularis]SNS07271.1 SEC-C motif-containing protein [Actinoplanes regularis]